LPPKKESSNKNNPADSATDKNKNRGKRENKLVTVFNRESDEEINQRKLRAQRDPIIRNEKLKTIADPDQYYGNKVLDFPKRPPWDSSMSKQQLEKSERNYFDKWLKKLLSQYPSTRLNYFENNLEVWRQLWRVIERSDLIMIITDARYPLFHFPPSLYMYLRYIKKPFVLILNKIDLIPNNVLKEWRNYFMKKFMDIKIITFSSFPRNQYSKEDERKDIKNKIKNKMKTLEEADDDDDDEEEEKQNEINKDNNNNNNNNEEEQIHDEDSITLKDEEEISLNNKLIKKQRKKKKI